MRRAITSRGGTELLSPALELAQVCRGILRRASEFLPNPTDKRADFLDRLLGELACPDQLVRTPDLSKYFGAFGWVVADKQLSKLTLGQHYGAKECIGVEAEDLLYLSIDLADLLKLAHLRAIRTELSQRRLGRADRAIAGPPKDTGDFVCLAANRESQDYSHVHGQVVDDLLVCSAAERSPAEQGIGDGLDDRRLAGAGIADNGDVVPTLEGDLHW
jgi:hypothetical protein